MHVALVVNTAWNAANFRIGLIDALQKNGYRVTVFAAADQHASKLARHNINFIPILLRAAGKNLAIELVSILRLRAALKLAGADVVLSFTPKANLYSILACVGSRRICAPNISGLGAAYSTEGWLKKLVTFMYQVCLKRAQIVFFQNKDDLEMFASNGLVERSCAVVVPGSGVNLQKFNPAAAMPQQSNRQSFEFLMIARALWDKGIHEFFSAAEMITQEGIECTFTFCGPLVSDNPTAVGYERMMQYFRSGPVKYLGDLEDVTHAIQRCCVVVLPSYREGMPRAVLEAEAMEKPVITTDSPGCRSSIIPGSTGILVPAKDITGLANAMRTLVGMSNEARILMGKAGRQFVENNFDEKIVHDIYLDFVRSVQSVGYSNRHFVRKKIQFT